MRKDLRIFFVGKKNAQKCQCYSKSSCVTSCPRRCCHLQVRAHLLRNSITQLEMFIVVVNNQNKLKLQYLKCRVYAHHFSLVQRTSFISRISFISFVRTYNFIHSLSCHCRSQKTLKYLSKSSPPLFSRQPVTCLL